MVRGPRRGNSASDRRMAKILRNSHGGYAGASIIEMLEAELTTACADYLELRNQKGADPEHVRNTDKRIEARGKIRGLATAVAMVRYPLRRHELVWWNYIKKLEKRHIKLAREQMAG